eukprot:scaffold124786_cov61-Phaeocystis_antarctica.AAC.5
MKELLPEEWLPSSSTKGSGIPSANGERSRGPSSLAFSGVSTVAASISVVCFTWTRTAALSSEGGGCGTAVGSEQSAREPTAREPRPSTARDVLSSGERRIIARCWQQGA